MVLAVDSVSDAPVRSVQAIAVDALDALQTSFAKSQSADDATDLGSMQYASDTSEGAWSEWSDSDSQTEVNVGRSDQTNLPPAAHSTPGHCEMQVVPTMVFCPMRVVAQNGCFALIQVGVSSSMMPVCQAPAAPVLAPTASASATTTPLGMWTASQAVHSMSGSLQGTIPECRDTTPAQQLETLGCTSVVLRNLPNNLTRDGLTELFDRQGCRGQYDFVHLPVDLTRGANRGYAFVNLVSPSNAEAFWNCFHGFSRWPGASRKTCEVRWNQDFQGLKALVNQFRDSPLMHEASPDEVRPVVLRNGRRMPFPQPTKELQPLRLPKHWGKIRRDAPHHQVSSSRRKRF